MLQPPPPEFSDGVAVEGLPGPRLEEEDEEEDAILREELMWLPVRIFECNEEEGDEEVMVLAEEGED